jgi:hypothetical protein
MQNIYKRINESKTKIGKSLSDVKHSDKMLAQDIINIKARTATVTRGAEGLALGKNIYDAHKRIDKEEQKVLDWVGKQKYEEKVSLEGGDQYADKDGNWIDSTTQTRDKFKRTDSKDLEWSDSDGNKIDFGDMFGKMETQKALADKKLDVPYKREKTGLSPELFKSSMQQFKDKESFTRKLTSSGVNITDVINKYGSSYAIDDKDELSKYHKYNYSSMGEDVDSMIDFFKEKKPVVDTVIDGGNGYQNYFKKPVDNTTDVDGSWVTQRFGELIK